MVARYVSMLRVSHYVKNLYVFLPAFFSGQLFHGHVDAMCALAFVAFCLVSSAVYIINDIIDRDLDRLHPEKKNRPIAAGSVSIPIAWFIAVVLFCLSGAISFLISWKFTAIIGGYFLLNLLYSNWLKNIAIVDVSIISIGFALRVLSGGVASNIWVSKWLIIMVFLLSMFQALAKRMDDLRLVGNDAALVLRKSLAGYNIEFLQITLSVLSGILIVCYIMYTVQPEIILRFGENAFFTAFFVLTGLLRYLQITFVHKSVSSPVKILWRDRFIQICILCWLLLFTILIYIK